MCVSKIDIEMDRYFTTYYIAYFFAYYYNMLPHFLNTQCYDFLFNILHYDFFCWHNILFLSLHFFFNILSFFQCTILFFSNILYFDFFLTYYEIQYNRLLFPQTILWFNVFVANYFLSFFQHTVLWPFLNELCWVSLHSNDLFICTAIN